MNSDSSTKQDKNIDPRAGRERQTALGIPGVMTKPMDKALDDGQTGELAAPPGEPPELFPHAPPMNPNAGQTGELATGGEGAD